MNSWTIEETYTLPSLGKVYGDININPVVRLRSMTTEEEMRRLAPTEFPQKQFADIIDDCLVDKLPISSYDLCLGDFYFLLHKLRVVTYGDEYKVGCRCPYCNCVTEKTINLSNLVVNKYTDDIDKYFEVDLPVTKKHIKLQMQTPRMLDDIDQKAKELNKKISGNLDSAFLYTIMSLIKQVDGKVLNKLELEEFVRKLPMKDTNYISQYAGKLNGKLGIDTTVDITCRICGTDYKSSFRNTQEFFRPTINI